MNAKLLGFAVAVVLFAHTAKSVDNGYGEEEHPDWAALVQAGAVTIPAGKAYVAYESDMQYVNALAAGKLVVNGTLILDDVETSFNKENLAYHWSGSKTGVIVKRGDSTYTHLYYDYQFGGSLVVEGGTFHQKNYYPIDGCIRGHIYVRSGATYRMSENVGLGDATLHIAGTGFNDGGALILESGIGDRAVTGLVLDDDATITVNKSGASISSWIPSPTTGRNWCLEPGILDLKGHDLTIGGTGATMAFQYISITNSAATTNTITFKGTGGATPRKLQLRGTATVAPNVAFAFPDDAQLDFSDGFTTLPSAIRTDGKLTVTGSGNTAKVLGGVISGTGSVTYGTADSKIAGSLKLGAANTYAGATTLNGATGFELRMAYPESVPGYATKLTVSTGSLVAAPGLDAHGDARWSAEDVLTLIRDTQITDQNRVATIDVTDQVGSEFLLGSTRIATYFPSLDIFWNASGKGAGRYTLEGPYTTEKPLNLKVTGGTVRLSGDAQINLGDVLVGGTSSTEGGTLLLDGAKDVVFGEQIIYIGKKKSGDAGGIGRLVVSNASIRSTGPLAQAAKSRIIVGAHARGILEIEAGGVVSNQVYVGGGGPNPHEGSGYGAIYQRGGLFVPVTTNSSYLSSSIGVSGAGYYQLEGGTLRPVDPARFSICGYGGYAGFVMTGGRFESQGLLLGANNGDGQVDFHQLGGTVVFPNDDYWGRVDVGAGGTGVRKFFITFAGANTSFHTGGNPGFLFGNVDYPNRSVVFNLNDGAVLETRNFQLITEAEKFHAKGIPLPMVLNANGGILKARINNTCLFGPSAEKALSKVTVYEKGLTIDTAGVAASTTQHRAITAAEAGGIQTVTLSAPVEDVILPNFRITSATGYGASLVPLFDTVTHTITNVYIASHGWGYTASDTIDIYDGLTRKRSLSADEFTVGDNVTGGLTKQGAGTLGLYNANTWAQWTRVLGGTLKMSEAGAIPSGTALTLSNGATIDFNNLAEPTFTAIDGTGGTAANGSVKVVGEEGILSVSAQKFIDREATAIAGTLDLSAVTEIALTDAEVLTEDVKSLKGLNLFSATTIVLPDEDVSITGVPKGWHVNLTTRGLRLAADKGMMLLLR